MIVGSFNDPGPSGLVLFLFGESLLVTSRDQLQGLPEENLRIESR